LRQPAPHDLVRRSARHVVAADVNGASGRPDDAADGIQQRALPGAVRAHERDPLADAHRQRHAVQGDRRPIPHHELPYVDEGTHSEVEPR
jgi:hypothetical protein